jgi:hypothetical protein
VTTAMVRLAAQAVRRPRLLAGLLAAAWRFRARGWWRRRPFLPLPPAEYVAWRMHTAYGDDGRLPTAPEMERYIRWANRMHRARGREARRS